MELRVFNYTSHNTGSISPYNSIQMLFNQLYKAASDVFCHAMAGWARTGITPPSIDWQLPGMLSTKALN
jgi:hypothetical protein